MSNLSNKIKNLYFILPYSFQNILVNIESLRIKFYRYNKNFYKIKSYYIENYKSKSKDIYTIRNELLKEFIYKIKNVKFYEKYDFDKILRNDNYIEKWEELPIINKEIVKKFKEEIINHQYIKNHKTLISHTSGTTGSGLVFPITLDAHQKQFAVWWRYRNLHGINENQWCGYFGGRKILNIKRNKTPYWHFLYPTKQIFFSIYHLNEDTIQSYVNLLNQKKPLWLHGYPSSIYNLAQLMKQKNLKLNYRLNAITVGAENLYENQKKIIEDVFGLYPIQNYGQAEGVANMSECLNGNLHIDEDYSFVELIKLEGNRYKLIGTNFTNPAFPLVRYDTNDVVIYTGRKCSCGLPGRVIDLIEGRNDDYVMLSDGVKVGRLDHIFKDFENIVSAQIIQEKIGELTVKVVKGKNFNEKDELKLLSEFKNYLGNIIIKIDYVSEIELTQSGKYKFVISKLNNTNN